ncbi:MAG: porin family protein [Bacteroidota bacterium]
MKTIKYLIAALVLVFMTQAQTATAQVAIKGGVNFASMNFDSEDTDLTDLAENGAVKFTIGASFVLPIGGDVLALQPEILFTQKGGDSSFSLAGVEAKRDYTYNYIDIPVLLRISLGRTYGDGLGFYLNGGPYAGYALNGRSERTLGGATVENDINFDDQDNQRRLDFGFAIGAGLTFGNLMVDLRYNHGTNNLLDDDADNSNDGDFNKLQHRGLALTAGFFFGS